MSKIIDGKEISKIKKEQLIEEVKKIKDRLTLVDVSVGFDEASRIYIRQKEKMAASIGYNFLNLHFDNIEEDDLIEEINKLNNNSKITGIIVQLPLPDNLDKDKIINTISPLKDVDGLTNSNKLKLINNNIELIPCTPKGIVSLLEYKKIDIIGKKIVIIGKSHLVGKPLFELLLNMGGTITLCHSRTKDLKEYTKDADIIISAVGKKDLITEDMIKENSIIIDVGINRSENGICGDVDYKGVFSKVAMITPVPGGVGPMTVISLMENVLIAYKLQMHIK